MNQKLGMRAGKIGGPAAHVVATAIAYKLMS